MAAQRPLEAGTAAAHSDRLSHAGQSSLSRRGSKDGSDGATAGHHAKLDLFLTLAEVLVSDLRLLAEELDQRSWGLSTEALGNRARTLRALAHDLELNHLARVASALEIFATLATSARIQLERRHHRMLLELTGTIKSTLFKVKMLRSDAACDYDAEAALRSVLRWEPLVSEEMSGSLFRRELATFTTNGG